MKSVLISIKPKWVEKIASGEKTIEVRKTRPKIETPFKCYIYATKPKKYYKVSRFMATSDENLYLVNGKIKMDNGFAYWGDGVDCEYLNRKVIGEFVCNHILHSNENAFIGEKPLTQFVLKQSCLTMEELNDYRSNKNIYAWEIRNLKIYDKPKELSEFKHWVNNKDYDGWNEQRTKIIKGFVLRPLTRPPQSWCYVEDIGD